MKLTLIFTMLVFLSFGKGFSQVTVSLQFEKTTIQELMETLENQTGYVFLYKDGIFDPAKRYSVDFTDEPFEEVLRSICATAGVDYEIRSNRQIILTEKKNVAGEKALAGIQQDRTVTGVVSDRDGQPLPGVTVVVKGTTRGTVTGSDGKFSLAIPDDAAVLQFSFVGMQTQEVPVDGRTTFTVVMEEEMIGLEEVVAIGYGTAKKESLTGAISNITSKDIRTTVNSSLAQQLSGKISGLQIRQYTGEPGDFQNMINIRGFGTPLFIIDGISGFDGAAFQKLNPEDIESISVLKDASAAIYGFNAANGVIIVTTKKGTAETTFDYSTVTGFQSPTNIPKMANAAQYMEMYNDAQVTIGGAPYIEKEELLKWQQGLPGYESTDWYDETFKKAAIQNQHNLSARGGNEKLNYYVSLGYFKDEGLLKSEDLNYKQYTIRSNLTANLAKNLVADISISGRNDFKETPGWDFANILKGTRIGLPIYRVYANENPDYHSILPPVNQHPLVYSERDLSGFTETNNKAFESLLSLTYNVPFIKNLKLKGLASYISNNKAGKQLSKSYNLYTYDEVNDLYVPNEFNTPSRISNSITDASRLTLQGYLIYNATIADNHNIGITLVYEQRQSKSRYSYLERQYDFYTNDQINQASVNNQVTGGYENESAFISYLGRVNYNYKGKYLLEFAARYDGSYRYQRDNRFGFFPVLSGGWRISEEPFIKENIPFISNLKIRGSYGVIGLDVGDPFQWVQGFSSTGGGGYEFVDGTYYSGVASPSIVNEYLTWATANTKDIGFDLDLFKGKVGIEFDVYQRDREGLLAYRSVSLPNTFGGTLPQENLNSDRTQGFEFSLAHNNTSGDFRYSAKFNFNYARTMWAYVETAPPASSYDKWRNYSSDRWKDVQWGYIVTGQFQNMENVIHSPGQNGSRGNTQELPGDYIYQDVNNDGVINSNDMMPIFWGGEPKLFYGIMLNAEWKKFYLNALFQGAGKYHMRFWGGGTYGQMFCFGGNIPEFYYDRWHPSDSYNPASEWIPGKWPATRLVDDVGSLYRDSEIWRKDASYLRFKSIEVGYTFTQTLIENLGIKDIRIYVNAHNLFTICDPWVKIFDPEKQEGAVGNTGLQYPLTKSYNLGINVSF